MKSSYLKKLVIAFSIATGAFDSTLSLADRDLAKTNQYQFCEEDVYITNYYRNASSFKNARCKLVLTNAWDIYSRNYYLLVAEDEYGSDGIGSTCKLSNYSGSLRTLKVAGAHLLADARQKGYCR